MRYLGEDVDWKCEKCNKVFHGTEINFVCNYDDWCDWLCPVCGESCEEVLDENWKEATDENRRD